MYFWRHWLNNSQTHILIQARSGGKKGLTQKEQIEVVRKFKEGGYNTIVATYVEEEGLDIDEVDLIVLYDVVKSLCVSMYKWYICKS